MTIFLPLLLAAAVPAQAAPAPKPAPPKEVSIPFADHNGLQSWTEGEDSDTLYVQDRRRQWYKVTLIGSCFQFTSPLISLGYTTSPGGSFDRFSKVFNPSEPNNSCAVTSVVESGPPPGHADKAVPDRSKDVMKQP